MEPVKPASWRMRLHEIITTEMAIAMRKKEQQQQAVPVVAGKDMIQMHAFVNFAAKIVTHG